MADARPARPQKYTPPREPRDTRRQVRRRPGMPTATHRPDSKFATAPPLPSPNPAPSTEEVTQ